MQLGHDFAQLAHYVLVGGIVRALVLDALKDADRPAHTTTKKKEKKKEKRKEREKKGSGRNRV